MNYLALNNYPLNKSKKVGRKIKLAISNISPEDRLSIIADIIIERILEEKNKPKII